MDRFINLIENLKALSLEGMQEVESFLHQLIIETKRHQNIQNQNESKTLYTEKKLKFYDNSSDLLNALNVE